MLTHALLVMRVMKRVHICLDVVSLVLLLSETICKVLSKPTESHKSIHVSVFFVCFCKRGFNALIPNSVWVHMFLLIC
jgi:hypothetical protein